MAGRWFRPSARDPRAAGQCDRCGFLFERRSLREQQEFRGDRLEGLGLFVCSRCLDQPQPGFRPLRLPPDPVPIPLPRPDDEVG